MKIKYFLRGVGIGIIITTLILGISYKSKMSDEAIISKAKKLGMEFADNSESDNTGADAEKTNEPAANDDESKNEPQDAEVSENPQKTEEPADVKEDSEATPVAAEPTPESEVSQTSSNDVQTSAPAATKAPPDNKNKKSSNKVVLVINRGDWSRKVAENLQELGVLDKAEEFDEYLVEKKYADRIKVGKFDINPDLSFEEIAKIITE